MDAVTTAERMTAEEFLNLEPLRRSQRRELIDGDVVVSEPTWMHNTFQGRIYFALAMWVRAGSARGAVGLPLDVLLDAHDVYAPDVVLYRDGRVPRLTDPPPYAPPDLVVEVRSPSTWRFDIGVKKSLYERRGVAELWLVDTAADAVLVYRRSHPDAPEFDVSLELDAGATLVSPLMPGFALPLAKIFAAD